MSDKSTNWLPKVPENAVVEVLCADGRRETRGTNSLPADAVYWRNLDELGWIVLRLHGRRGRTKDAG